MTKQQFLDHLRELRSQVQQAQAQCQHLFGIQSADIESSRAGLNDAISFLRDEPVAPSHQPQQEQRQEDSGYACLKCGASINGNQYHCDDCLLEESQKGSL